MGKDKFKIGLDGLKLCFKDSSDKNVLFNRLFDGSDKIWWGEDEKEDFYTLRVENEENVQVVNIFIPDEDKSFLFGTLSVHFNKGKYSGMIFLSIENKTLYTDTFHYLGYILGCFNLTFNNITSIVPAITTTRNYIYQVQLKRHDLSYDMIYNGKKIMNPDETIKDWINAKGCSRRKIYQTPTLYFGQAKNVGIRIRMYDKLRELTEHSPEKKETLNAWLGFDYEKLYRIEAEISNVSMRELCTLLNEFDSDYFHDDRILSQIFSERFLLLLLQMALHKVVYWKKDNKVIDLLDL